MTNPFFLTRDFPVPLNLLMLKKSKNASNCFVCVTSAVLYVQMSLLYTLNTSLSSGFFHKQIEARVYSDNGYAVGEVR